MPEPLVLALDFPALSGGVAAVEPDQDRSGRHLLPDPGRHQSDERIGGAGQLRLAAEIDIALKRQRPADRAALDARGGTRRSDLVGAREQQRRRHEGEHDGCDGGDDPGAAHSGGIAISPPSSLNCVLSSR
jgi:hypothetical protein